jgi:ribonuclease HII
MSPSTGDFVPHTCVVEGDNTYISIAAASILAKTHRDAYMRDVLHVQYPGYGWNHNMGYGAKVHMDALRTLGATPVHRATFAPVRAALQHARA